MGSKILKKALALMVFAALSLPVAAYSTDRLSGARQSREIAAEVNQKLQDDDQLRAVRAIVDDGVVTLRGSVSLYVYKEKAEKKARKVKNVAEVRNLIQVRTGNASDRELAERLARKLAYNPYGFYSRYGTGSVFDHLTVAVQDGVVTVGGEVRSASSRDYAVDAAKNEKGVRGVVDQVQVLPTSFFDDDIRLRVARAIYGDPVLQRYAIDPGAPIRIVVEHGHVTLYGVVSNHLESQVAEVRAREVPGAFSVENRLIVSSEIPR